MFESRIGAHYVCVYVYASSRAFSVNVGILEVCHKNCSMITIDCGGVVG